MAAGKMKAFGMLLRQHRTRAGLTQEGLAERARMSVRGVIYPERGTRQPYPDTLHRLAAALDLTGARRDAPTDARAADSPVSVPGDPAAHAAPLPAPTSLIGHDRGLAVLRDRFAAPLTGRGSLVLIGGEAGVGKTALADTIGRDAAVRRAMALVGRCFDVAETPPYGPWIEVRAICEPLGAKPAQARAEAIAAQSQRAPR